MLLLGHRIGNKLTLDCLLRAVLTDMKLWGKKHESDLNGKERKTDELRLEIKNLNEVISCKEEVIKEASKYTQMLKQSEEKANGLQHENEKLRNKIAKLKIVKRQSEIDLEEINSFVSLKMKENQDLFNKCNETSKELETLKKLHHDLVKTLKTLAFQLDMKSQQIKEIKESFYSLKVKTECFLEKERIGMIIDAILNRSILPIYREEGMTEFDSIGMLAVACNEFHKKTDRNTTNGSNRNINVVTSQFAPRSNKKQSSFANQFFEEETKSMGDGATPSYTPQMSPMKPESPMRKKVLTLDLTQKRPSLLENKKSQAFSSFRSSRKKTDNGSSPRASERERERDKPEFNITKELLEEWREFLMDVNQDLQEEKDEINLLIRKQIGLFEEATQISN